MSNRYRARIEIGGGPSRQHLPRFCRLLAVSDESALLERLAEGRLLLENEHAERGEFYELESVCRDLELPCRRHSEGYWEHPPELVFWQSDMEEPESQCGPRPGPPLPLCRLQAADGLGGKGDEAVGMRPLLLAQISHYRTHVETEPLSIGMADSANLVNHRIVLHGYSSMSSSGVHITGQT